MAERLRPHSWCVLMVGEQQSELYFAIVVADAAEASKIVRPKVGEGIAGWVAKHAALRAYPSVWVTSCAALRSVEKD